MVEEPTGWLEPPKTKATLERQIAELRAENDRLKRGLMGVAMFSKPAALSGSGAGGWRETPTAKTLDDWHEDDGFVVWWTRQHDRWLGEPSYIGSPLCSDWPGYHTHWTPHPAFPAAPTGEAS